MLCAPNEHCEVVLNELLCFRVGEEEEGGELRLVMLAEEDGERVVGRYEFQLGNYMRAYEELRRNCVELSVQIAPHYSLLYEVFLERTPEALQRIIREHQAAVRFNMHAEVLSDIDSFLPHEITNQNLEQIYRDIRIDEASPLLFSQRFWSPKRARLILSKTSLESMDRSANSLAVDGNRVSLIKLSKSVSTSSDLELSRVRKPHSSVTNVQEMDL